MIRPARFLAVALLWLLVASSAAVSRDAAATASVVPFELIGNHIYVPIEARGTAGGPVQTMRFVFDSGATALLTPQAAHALGLEPHGDVPMRGSGEDVEHGQRTRVAALRLGSATLNDVRAGVLSLPAAVTELGSGPPVGGLIGQEFLRRYVVKIDYVNRLLTLASPSEFVTPTAGRAIPCTINGGMPVVSAELDGRTGTFVIDTGNSTSIALLTPYVEREHLREFYASHVHRILGRGVGGYFHGDAARAASFVIGGFALHDQIVDLSSQRAGFFASTSVDGNLGTGVLRNFTVTLDYPHRMVYLDPDLVFDAPPSFDRSGMYLERDGEDFRVVEAMSDAPAGEAGLEAGDRIVEIDGKPARDYLAARIGETLSGPAGRKLALEVVHGTSPRSVVLVLRNLI
ncbi:MAG: aspartyl protease family protein [Candidatus Eremiobacteraeota bacterium]|nr:aspartyl protease family protein [Candidatus Eremiobacteraeota bacterium]MBV8354991.1 aspartyl protease family protein [Candidatus Eremiobacteraeota bacterium]